MERLGWPELDILFVTGDAYVDHPAFGAALLGRWLVSHGFRAGIVAQPRWNTPDDVAAMGRPRLFAGITAGAMDSMLAHYTAFRKKRRDDAYSPGGKAGLRPNRATIVYTSVVRSAFPGLPVVLGGIEASLRRATHYDFWSDQIRRPILLDSKADLLVYGMGERAVLEVATRLRQEPGSPVVLRGIPGTAWTARRDTLELDSNEALLLPSHEEIEEDSRKLMTATLVLERHVHEGFRRAVQAVGDRTVVIEPPARPLTTSELDTLYALPFTRRAHPAYKEPIPAVEMIQFSVTTHRGCGGGCSFCSLALHQGRRIASRSAESILHEVTELTGNPEWKGSLTDIGGPSANMWGAKCLRDPARCRRASCLTPAPCRHFRANQRALIDLLCAVSRIPGVNHVRVASGVRHDLALQEPEYVDVLTGRFTGGQLKVAPEHLCDEVLRLMRKPPFQVFLEFMTVFERESRQARKEQYLVPYLISAFPGCTDAHMRELARWLRERGWKPQQVQCFIPTPGTVATAMFYAGVDPDGNPIHVARTDAQRLRQHGILVGSRSSGSR